MKIRPWADRILLKRIDVEERVRGSIIIPDTAKEKPLEAEVIAVGPGKANDGSKQIPLNVKVGNRVLIGKYAGTEVEIDGEEYAIVHDVTGILE